MEEKILNDYIKYTLVRELSEKYNIPVLKIKNILIKKLGKENI